MLGLIGAGASILGGLLGSRSQSKASKRATAAAQQAQAQNNALQRDYYQQNSANLQPYNQVGLGAMNRLNSLLSYGPQMGRLQDPGAPMQSGVNVNRPGPAQSLTSGVSYNALSSALSPYAGPMRSNMPQSGPLQSSFNYRGPLNSNLGPAQSLTSGMLNTALNPGSLDSFRDSTGYNFRLNEGNNNILQNFAATGAAQSGAALKELQNYGQNMASQERQNYLGELSNYTRYNDDFAQRERGYGDQRGMYLDEFANRERGVGMDAARYQDQFVQGERAFGVQQGAYQDQFAQNERAYGDQRGQYADTFNRGERDTRNALATYADQFANNERGYGDQRADYGRQYDMAVGQYADQFGANERQYQDQRNDYNRTYTDNRYDNYLGLLANQQALGMNAVGALAGVGGNYANNVSANNNSAATVAANAALQRGNAQGQMYGQIAGGIGNALGGLNSGYRGNLTPPAGGWNSYLTQGYGAPIAAPAWNPPAIAPFDPNRPFG